MRIIRKQCCLTVLLICCLLGSVFISSYAAWNQNLFEVTEENSTAEFTERELLPEDTEEKQDSMPESTSKEEEEFETIEDTQEESASQEENSEEEWWKDDFTDSDEEEINPMLEENLILEEDLLPEEEIAFLAASDSEHGIIMPDLTSQYFSLQKKSKPVSSAVGEHLITLANEKEVSQYMQKNYPQGELYGFIPRFTKNTTVTVGGGNGGSISKEAIAGGSKTIFGELYSLSSWIASKAFDLQKCTSRPYALYTNVGTWYDKRNNETFSVDMKCSIEDYVYPSDETLQMMKHPYQAPYAAFSNKNIGIITMGTDSVKTKMEFYYHGTNVQIPDLKGILEFIDIDAQQGVDFSTGFQDIILFSTKLSHIRYCAEGLAKNTIGYICSGTVEGFDYRDINTTAMGIFSGSSVECVWTLAKCDHKDTGGAAKYQDKAGYQIPADDTFETAKCYSTTVSSGFLGIDTDVAMVSLPAKLQKAIYAGPIQSNDSSKDCQSVSLANRENLFTFVLSAAAGMPSDVEKAYYKSFEMKDVIDPLLQVENIKVFAGISKGDRGDDIQYTDVTSKFTCRKVEEKQHATLVTASADPAWMKEAAFYGKTYYVSVEARFKTPEECEEQGLSIESCYQEDNAMASHVKDGVEYQGSFAVENKGNLHVVSSMDTEEDMESNYVTVKIPMEICVQKKDEESNKAVKGVVFGLFGGEESQHKITAKEALLTVTTDEEGIARFHKDTFFTKEYGDGPYYIKEVSVPEAMHRVWESNSMKEWKMVLDTLQAENLLASNQTNHVTCEMVNHNVRIPANIVKVIKKSKETGQELKGAVFTLLQWSEKKGEYLPLMELTEKESEGRVYYYNKEAFTNTMDNLGSYKIVESVPPKGCIPTEEEWTFTIEEDMDFEKTAIIYRSSVKEEEEKGNIICENTLQKGSLEIVKKDEKGKLLAGTEFSVVADEDIYAPWQKENEKPLLSKGERVAKVKTGEDGIAKAEDLYIGKYTVTETEATAEYVRSKENYSVELQYDDQKEKEEVIVYKLSIVNKKMKPSLSIAKMANKTCNDKGEKPSFDEKTGRYSQEKIPAGYMGGEEVDYTITVTNTGNVDLQQLEIREDIGHPTEGNCLKECIDWDNTEFVLPANHILKSKQGKNVEVNLNQKNKLLCTLDQMEAGDAVEIHFKTKVKEGIGNQFRLENDVYAEGYYARKESVESKEDLVKVDTENLKDTKGNSLVMDKDFIHIPGEPKISVAKTADKTQGVTLEDGRYKGSKVEGTYEPGESVDYRITVSNKGSADLYQVKVTDLLSKELMSILKEDSIRLESGSLNTKKGNHVEAILKETGNTAVWCVVLDKLEKKDSVELHLTADIKETEEVATENLENEVKVQGLYYRDEKILSDVPETDEMKDKDKIQVGKPKLCICKLADKTSNVTIENGRAIGEKVAGRYQKGEKVEYRIRVTNTGTATAFKLIVSDVPSDDLLKNVDIKGFAQKKGSKIKTEKGKVCTVLATTLYKIALDQLEAGDAVTLTFTAEIKENPGEKAGKEELLNTVSVTGKTADNQKILETPEMKDEDTILLKETEDQPASGDGQKTASDPKTGDENNLFLMVMVICVGVLFIFRLRKKD